MVSFFVARRRYTQELGASGAPAEGGVGQRDTRSAAPLVTRRRRQRRHGPYSGRPTADELRPVQPRPSVHRHDVRVRQRRELDQQLRQIVDRVLHLVHGPGDRAH